MSRLKRLKEKRRKNTIKTTMASLALTLAIGSAQTMGTYALFIDTEDVTNNLTISTGDVDVKIDGNRFNIEHIIKNDDEDKAYTIPEFKIINEGTLKQNLKLRVSNINNINEIDRIAEEIEYNFTFYDVNGKEILSKEVELSTLMGKGIELKYDSGELVVLDSDEFITVKGSLDIDDDIDEYTNELVNKTMNIELNVLASQINNDKVIQKDGFYDKAVQNNTITFGEANIIVDGEGMKVAGNGQPENQFIEVYPTKDFNPIPENIEFISGTGLFENAKVGYKNSGAFEIRAHIYDKKLGYKFKDDFGTDKIVIRFIYGDTTKEIEFDFRKAKNPSGNRVAEAKYTILKEYKTIKEPVKEEISEPNNTEAVESPDEEIYKPSEQDIIEPPKEEVELPSEQEAVGIPKEEEIVVPSKPDIIVPAKEEIEIQE